jgi:hypothetical protein
MAVKKKVIEIEQKYYNNRYTTDNILIKKKKCRFVNFIFIECDFIINCY